MKPAEGYDLYDILKKISIGHKLNKEYMRKYCYTFIKCLLQELLTKKCFRIMGFGKFYASKNVSFYKTGKNERKRYYFLSPKFKFDTKTEDFINDYDSTNEYSHLTKKGVNV